LLFLHAQQQDFALPRRDHWSRKSTLSATTKDGRQIVIALSALLEINYADAKSVRVICRRPRTTYGSLSSANSWYVAICRLRDGKCNSDSSLQIDTVMYAI
jgi:hypothetical protein